VSRKPKVPQPTNAELEILGVLWRDGPRTVREVHERLERRDVGYTTVLKLMQIMVDKGLLRRDASARSHVYEAAFPEREVKKRLVSDLLDRAFEGSAAGLVMHALESRPASAAELAQIRSLLDAMNARGDS
jgi:predicted transcriptional regulator